jgi:Na+-driven multidrug efflux pump
VACVLATIANLTTVMVTAQLRHYGTVTVAAYGISARLEFMIIPLSFGIGAALTSLVGKAVGAGDWRLARRTAWAGGIIAWVVTGVWGIGIAWRPMGFVSLFTPDPHVANIAGLALGIIGPAYGGFGLGMVMYFAAMGAHRMGWPIVAALSRFGLAVGGGYVLANGIGGFEGLGLQGHFIGVALGITSYGLFAAMGVRKSVWH